MRAKRRLERTLGYGLLGLAALALLVLFSRAGVRAEVSRLATALTGGSGAGDVVVAVPSHEGISPGLPVYRVLASGDARPVGHVVETTSAPPRIRLRPAPGESLQGLTNLTVFPPSRKLSAALALAVPEAEAKAFGAEVAKRLQALWLQRILPDVQQRLPEFVKRIDPTQETQAKALFNGLSQSLLTRAQPVMDEALGHVVNAVKEKLGVLDSLGLLWDLVRGDEAGIKDALLPTAKEAATQWWNKNQRRVLSMLGDGIAAHWPQIRDWLTGELLDSAMEELVQPVFESNRALLEAEGERIMREAVRRFVEAPGGGFRIRFASLLRHNLLNKKTALLLWLPEDSGGR